MYTQQDSKRPRADPLRSLMRSFSISIRGDENNKKKKMDSRLCGRGRKPESVLTFCLKLESSSVIISWIDRSGRHIQCAKWPLIFLFSMKLKYYTLNKKWQDFSFLAFFDITGRIFNELITRNWEFSVSWSKHFSLCLSLRKENEQTLSCQFYKTISYLACD